MIVASGPGVTVTVAVPLMPTAARLHRVGEGAGTCAGGEQPGAVDRAAARDDGPRRRERDDVTRRILSDGGELLRCADGERRGSA